MPLKACAPRSISFISTRIIHDATERVPDGVELPLDDSGIDVDSEVASIISKHSSRNDVLYNEYSLLPEEVRKRLGLALVSPAKEQLQPPPRECATSSFNL
ncbi:hypothetical protein TRAPUB_2629 [Trametes pubescens]|uniref:Uncharacterized protein n=1 Tax=Trametes pubescens TaxID=154538 RepID=A0A1M2VG16_TRAPU|nr:hypothetical protein TRAPUB_2629 [Trametes pubescens]